MIRALICKWFHLRMTMYPRSESDGRAYVLCEVGHKAYMPQWDRKPVVRRSRTTELPTGIQRMAAESAEVEDLRRMWKR